MAQCLCFMFGTVEEWCAILSSITELVGRGLSSKGHQSSGVAQVLIGLLGRLIEATAERGDRATSADAVSLAAVVHVIDKVKR